jgi:hypothetical protein
MLSNKGRSMYNEMQSFLAGVGISGAGGRVYWMW